MAFAVFGWGYLAWFLGHMLFIHQHLAGGAGLMLVLGPAVAMSDIGAYVVGKAIRATPCRSSSAWAPWGDLVESALKREFGVKDAGACSIRSTACSLCCPSAITLSGWLPEPSMA